MPTFQVLNELYNSYLSSCNVLIVSLVNTLQDISLLQSSNALILLHLSCTDPVLQLDQLVLQAVKVILVSPIPTHLSLHRLITEGLDAQVHLVPIRVPSTKEPHVRYGVTWVLTEVEKGGGI
jgi:hypothetical protein